VGIPKFPKLGLLWLWGSITLHVDLRLRWGLQQSCSSPRELSNGMWHATCTQFLEKTKTWTKFKETGGFHSARRSRVPTSIYIYIYIYQGQHGLLDLQSVTVRLKESIISQPHIQSSTVASWCNIPRTLFPCDNSSKRIKLSITRNYTKLFDKQRSINLFQLYICADNHRNSGERRDETLT